MYKGSRVSRRKKARRPAPLQPTAAPPTSVVVEVTAAAGGSARTSQLGQTSQLESSLAVVKETSKTKGEMEVPTFEEFLTNPNGLNGEDDTEEECAEDVVLYFNPRAPPPPTPSSQPATATASATGRPVSSAVPSSSKTSTDVPLYSSLPTISLKTNPAPTNILSDFGKTFGKGVQKVTQQAKAPLVSVGDHVNTMANQIATNLPVIPQSAPPPPPKKSQLENLLEHVRPKRLFRDVSMNSQPRLVVVYSQAVIVGKDVTQPNEKKLAIEVEGAVLLATPIESQTQSEQSQKKLMQIFGSFKGNVSTDFDFASLPRFIVDCPGTPSVKFSESLPTVDFATEDDKTSFLEIFSQYALKIAHKDRHQVVQGTIWSAVIVEDLEALTRFPPESVNSTDHAGRTALHYAASLLDGGQAVSILLGMGADPNVLDDELSAPLHLAARAGNVLAVHSLLRAGADADARDLSERTSFFWAAYKSCTSGDLSAAEPFIQVLEALVDVGRCDVEVRDTDDRTALHLCIDESSESSGARVETLGALLRAPLNLDPSSIRGELARTPLHILCVDKVEDPEAIRIATILLESGARVNACDKRGDTPLFLLLRGDVNCPYPFMVEQRSQIATLLVRFGARLDIPNLGGHVPAEAAKFQRINLEDAIAKWTAKKEPSQCAQMASDPKMLWNLPRAADKSDVHANGTPNKMASVTARFNKAINDNISMPWQSESEASQCFTCRKPFSMLQRKYHCRHCGLIHCSQCTTKYFTMCPPISQPAVAVKDRVCDSCFNGMCSSVERTALALVRLSQDREALKKRLDQENREQLGLSKEPSAIPEKDNMDTAQSSANKAKNALGERGEKLQSLNEKTARMRDDAQNFAELASKLRQQQEKSLWPF